MGVDAQEIEVLDAGSENVLDEEMSCCWSITSFFYPT